MKTRKQFREWLEEQIPEVDNTKPDSEKCQKVARCAGKLSCRHGLGGDYLLRSEQVTTPTQTVALLADCLAALQVKGDDTGPFTVEEVAERWGCSVRTVGDLIRNGELGCFRPGLGRGVVRISLEHIAEYERGQAANSNGRGRRHRHLI